jgi:putative membrane protein
VTGGPHPMPAGAAPGAAEWVVATAAAIAAAAYLAGVLRLRGRGDQWPQHRDVCFAVGTAALAAALLVPLPGEPFTAHTARHLVVAMAAPVLLVVARPVTLALRVLRPGRARRALLGAARSRPAAWAVFPPLAAALDVGGLWLLYRTPLGAAAEAHAALHALVQVHLVGAGLLFAFAVCGLDPMRRRWSPAWRGLTLLAAGAAHAVLAKSLYAAPPPGTDFAAADVQAGAQLMYYGGDLVELALAVVLARQWYTAAGRAEARRRRRARSCPVPAGPLALGTAALETGPDRERPWLP